MSAERRAKKNKLRRRLRRCPASGNWAGYLRGGEQAACSSSESEQNHGQARAVSRRRLWVFRLCAAAVFPILLVLAAELSLRIIGYGFDPRAIVTYEAEGRQWCCDNVKFGWRFFPRNIARETEPFIFPAEKPPNTHRIFILGASAAQGTPEPAYGFGRFLQKMLEDKYPQANFEIINTAMTAINSHVVLPMAKDCARHDPDLFIVYLGNNEVNGPYGIATLYNLPLTNLTLIRTAIALKAARVGQLLNDLLESLGLLQNAREEWLGLTMFMDKQVRADSPRLQAVYRNFQTNLQDIRRAALRSCGRIVFCTVGSNLKDSPPFACGHRADRTPGQLKEWEDIYRQGTEHESKGDYINAIEYYLRAAKIDETYADLQFRLGNCYLAVSEYENARLRYIRARDFDALRFRADTRINDVIRSVAAARAADGVRLVDAVKVFEKGSPHSIPGEELFYEHVHLNFRGNYLLAEEILKQVEQMLAPDLAGCGRAQERTVLTESGCGEHLAYTGWDRYQTAGKVLNGFIKHPPFTNQLYHEQRTQRMERQLDELKNHLTAEALERAALQYRNAIGKSPSDWHLHWNYGKLLTEGLKDYESAAEQCSLLSEYLPHCYLVNTVWGAVLRGQGKPDAAVPEYLRAIRIKPTCIEAHYHLALIYQKQGRVDESIEYYSRTLKLQPTHIQAYNNLVEILYHRGDIERGIEVCRRALRFVPDSANLHCNLGILLNEKGRGTEAVEELKTAVELDPNSPEIRRVLRSILKIRN
jgi:tetratricopeptide (TPR) repeat protein